MEEIINKLINYHIKGVDTYTHSNSTWLIFTKTKQWVIELTDNKTLWYNYNFFKSVFSFLSLEVVENQHLITKWVEDNVMNGSKNTPSPSQTPSYNLVEVVENGVKETSHNATMFQSMKVEDTIKNGIKETRPEHNITEGEVDDIIQDGMKETKISPIHTEYGDWLDGDERLDDIIENGIKETQFNWHENKSWVEGVIKGGVKQTLPEVGRYINDVEEVIEGGVKKTHFDSREIKTWIDGVINKGVKQTSHRRYLKTFNIDDTIQDGTENDYWVMDGHDTPVDEVLDNGIKEVISYDEHKRGPVNTLGYIDDIIKEGEKINGTYAGGQRQSEKCESVVEYGTKNPTD